MTRAPAALVAAIAGLVLAPPVHGAYRPTLLVEPEGSVPGQLGTRIVLSQPAAHDATATALIALPDAYGLALQQPPGTVLGTARARVTVRGFDVGPIALSGPVVAAGDPQPAVPSVGCDAAVDVFGRWQVELAAPTGQRLNMRLLVVRTGVSWGLAACFPSPYLPEDQGGAPLGLKVVSAELTLTSAVLSAPVAPGRYVWRGLFRPYVNAPPVLPATPLRGNEVEARAIVSLPARVTLGAKLVRGRRPSVVVSGRFREGSTGAARARVELWEAADARGRQARRVARATTRVDGGFSFRRPAPRPRWYSIRVPARDATARDCGSSAAEAGCVSATAAPAASRWVRAPAARRR